MFAPSFLHRNSVILDVRSPAEFAKAHVPNAVNLPLFSDEERHQVGICYKNLGQDAAVKLGLKFVGPKLSEFVHQASEFAPEKRVGIYCWRGGKRSEAMQWLLEFNGFQCERLSGGYKSFRRWVIDAFKNPHSFTVIGGFTGTGKTAVLSALRDQGQKIIDLEDLANHRGSAFGMHGSQPSNEHFENLLALHLHEQRNHPIWIEDESKMIGHIVLPADLRRQIQQAPLVMLERGRIERIDHLCELYGRAGKSELIHSFKKIQKRIGLEAYKTAETAILNGDLSSACSIALDYYDRAYQHGLKRSERQPILRLDISRSQPDEVALKLIEWSNKNLRNSPQSLAAAAR